MTPNPPSSSEGSSFPRRGRPNLGGIVKDSTELDLWAFDEQETPVDMAVDSQSEPVAEPPAGLPMPRERRKNKKVDAGEVSNSADILRGRKSIQVGVNQEASKTPDATTERVAPPDEFDDLEEPNQWEDKEKPELSIHPKLLAPVEGPVLVELEDPSSDDVTLPTDPVSTQAKEEIDEFSPIVPKNSEPVSLVPRLKLSKLEWAGLSALCALLLGGVIVVFFNTIYRLPSEAKRLKAGDFPVVGKHLAIETAESYWRPPVTEGKDAETFRRGTQLLPVVELTSSGSPGAVRVIFRDQEGRGAGDVITRAITPGVPLQVAATTGFEDLGMHAAYRTGQGEPWTIEVLEAPSGSASNAEFKKLFEIEISTDRR